MFRAVLKSYLGDRRVFSSPNVSGLWDNCPTDVACNCIRSQNTSQQKQPQRNDDWINLGLCCLRLNCCWRCFLHGSVCGTTIFNVAHVPFAASASGIKWCHGWKDTGKRTQENDNYCRDTQQACLRTIPSTNKSVTCVPVSKNRIMPWHYTDLGRRSKSHTF
jgi:hypothetical protein